MKGSLPDGWKYLTVDEVKAQDYAAVAIGPFGSRMKADVYVNDGIPVIRGTNISDTKVFNGNFVYISKEMAKALKSSNVYDGDLVFPHRGSIGEVGIITGGKDAHYILSSSLMKLTPNRDLVDSLFLFYFFRSDIGRHELLKNASQVGTPGIATPLASLKSVQVCIPPLPEQRAIAGILGALDDKIEVNRRMNATLEAIARAVFRQWFVENEEIENWKVGKLGDVIRVNEHSISKEYQYSEIEYIDISSVTTGSLENTTPYFLADAPSRARRLVKHGDTIWSTVRPNRKSYLFISNPQDNLIVSTGFAVLTPEKIPPSYLYFLTTTDQFVDYLVSNADGSAYPAVGAERFADAEVRLPPKEILDKFEDIVGVMLARISSNEEESRTLGSLRDSLLPKLMRGEVRVKEVEGR